MKPKQTILAVIVLLLVFFNQANSQTFQNTFLPTNDDNYVAGVAVNGEYYAIGNTKSFSGATAEERILFSRYSSGGASVSDRIIYDAPNPTHLYTATDVQAGYSVYTASPGNSVPEPPCIFTTCTAAGTSIADISDPNSRKYFYATGYYRESSTTGRRLLIMKLNNGGTVLWSRTNLSPPNPAIDEAGVSVESCPNRDAIVVSVTTNLTTGMAWPTITRLDSAGTLIWRYHYFPGPNDPPGSFFPRQSCIYSEQIAGTVSSAIGITIIGDMNAPGAAGTTLAAMRVKYNGEMIWKQNYMLLPPLATFQYGWDIMTEHNSLNGTATVAENFVMTGASNVSASGPGFGSVCMVAQISTITGVMGPGWVIAPPGSSMFYGQGIYQALSPKSRVVVTGGVTYTTSGAVSDVHLFKFNPATGILDWARNYPLTTPNYPRTESVVSVGNSYPSSGYFLSTNSFDTYGGGTTPDAHVIKTDALGNVNAPACPSDTLPLTVSPLQPQSLPLCTNHECDSVIVKSIAKQNITAPHVLCFSALRLTEENVLDYDISVYPNPATREIILSAVSPEALDATLEIISVTGQVFEMMDIDIQEGKNEMQIDIHSLPSGVYIMRVLTVNGTEQIQFVKTE